MVLAKANTMTPIKAYSQKLSCKNGAYGMWNEMLWFMQWKSF